MEELTQNRLSWERNYTRNECSPILCMCFTHVNRVCLKVLIGSSNSMWKILLFKLDCQLLIPFCVQWILSCSIPTSSTTSAGTTTPTASQPTEATAPPPPPASNATPSAATTEAFSQLMANMLSSMAISETVSLFFNFKVRIFHPVTLQYFPVFQSSVKLELRKQLRTPPRDRKRNLKK